MSAPGGASGGGPEATHLEVTRTARVWMWGPVKASDVWVVLHGYRQLAGRFLRRFEPLVSEGVRVLAPEGLSRFYLDEGGGSHGPDARIGATWMTREDREVEIVDYVRYLDRVHQAYCRTGPAPRITALGFSQGVHTLARWLSFGDATIHRAVFWGARLPSDLDLASVAHRWSEPEVILVHGEADPYDSAAGREQDDRMLAAAGIAARRCVHGEGHRIESGLLRTLR